MFHVGQKVVTLVTWDLMPPGVSAAPVQGQIYTVRDIASYPYGVGLRLEEIHNPTILWTHGFDEAAFHADFFRPLHSIQIFRDIANGVKQPERENA